MRTNGAGAAGPRVAIVGAGFSGIAMAIELRRAGIEDFTLYERAGDLGGVWHHNTYPGAACDVPSYLYSFSYAQRRDWSRPCSPQAEILDYLHDLARRHGIERSIRTGTEIESADFDEDTARWRLRSAAGETFEADVLVLACGQLSRPAWPRIPGRERFAGHSFHSAEWDHDYEMRGKRVAVIGTGASAIQFVPELAERAARLDVYQRSAPYMLPRANPLYPGWAKAAIRFLPGAQWVRRHAMLAFMEYFIFGLTRFRPATWPMEALSRSMLLRQVPDRELRRKLTPDHRYGCKRILFSSLYYPALGRPNVELVTDAIAEIDETAIVTADGARREVDCVVYGTGFRANKIVAPMRVTGREGLELQERWSDGAEAHHGIAVSGFPNMFMLYGPNTNLGVGSIIVMIEAQAGYVVDALRELGRRGTPAIEVRPEVQAASSVALQARLRDSVWTGCGNWYADESGRIIANWPGHMTEYERVTAAVDPAEYRSVGGAASHG